jgi:peroxiredoxin/mono/diheme cytochrome c family protein
MRRSGNSLWFGSLCALLAGSMVISSALMSLAVANDAEASHELAARLGHKVASFALQDYRGKEVALDDVKDAKLVVVAFLGVECPLSKLYAPKLVKLAADYEAKGVKVIGIDPNRQDAVTEMAAFANEHKLNFPLLKDLNNKLADEVGAARVPQVFVLDGERAIRYAGRVDDQYGFDTGTGYAKTNVKRQDLTAALDELLAGKQVSEPQTKAIGCLIGRVRPVQENAEVTYSKHIAPIFQDRCVECHRPGQIGPFALQSYDDAVGWAEMIEEVVRDNRMPPWHPDPKFGHFSNDISLSKEEKDLIYRWVAAGAPEGDPKDLPQAKEYSGSWMMPGQPDAVFYMTEEPVDIPAEGTVDYRYYIVDTGFTEDKWVQVAECMPGNRAVVHHIIVFLKPPVAGEAKSGRGAAGGQASFGQLCGFAPGTRPIVLRPGMAKLIPAGYQLVFQLHYTPNGSPQKDRSAVGMKFVDPSTVTHRVATSNAMNGMFKIPAGDPAYKVESTRTYGKDVQLLSVFPHMHLRGKDFHYELIYPDGRKETIMNMPRYDFNWQTSYIFNEPMKLPAGTTMHCTAHFDNSADNAANPDPSQPVRWGDQTWEEMMIGWFDIAVPKDWDIAEVLPPVGRRRRGDDGDGEKSDKAKGSEVEVPDDAAE